MKIIEHVATITLYKKRRECAGMFSRVKQHMPYTRESGYLQNMVENGITFSDRDRDAVEKLRVSNPQSLIDTDFEYSLQNSKWEFLTLCNNYPGVYARSNEPAFTSEQITSIMPSGPGNKSVTVTVNILPRAPFKIGDSVVLKETANTTYVDGAYIITAVLSPYSFQVVTKSPAALVGEQKTVYTALYTGGFYTNAEIPIVGVSAIGGTKDALIQFSNPHNLYIKTPITVVDYSLSAVPWSGSFEVKKVLDDYRVTYETLTGSNYSSTTRVIPASGGVYARTEGVAVHRFFDGGVQINPGTSAPNARIMRQTRKYFKYQSGKSMQFSTGVLFRPVYEVTNAYIDKTSYTEYYNSFLTDSSTNNFQLTAFGNTQASTSVKKYGDSSAYFDGNGGYLEIADNNDFELQGNDFTVEMWFQVSTLKGYQALISKSYTTADQSGWILFFETGGSLNKLYFLAGNGSWSVALNSNFIPVVGTWYHVAVTRSGNTWRLYVDGVLKASTTNSLVMSTGTLPLYVGWYPYFSGSSSTQAFHGYIDDLRITKGVARYTTTFTPPTAQLPTTTDPYYNNVSLLLFFSSTATPYPYYDFVISTEQYHGFAQPDTYKQGVTIKTRGFELSAINQTNPYNKTFVVNNVLNSKTFSVQIPVNAQFNPFPTTDLSPGGISYVEVQGWNDATVRTGLFEDQNGMFFEFDGKDFWAVRRFTTTPINGTVSVQTKSPWLVGTNTKFISQLNVNDFVNVQGMSYQVGSIVNDLSATVTPTYRGPNAEGLKVVLTKETRVHQSEFNLDKLDGTGPSGYTLDLNRMQMMFIDYSWYGAGKIRYGIRADKGKIIYFHEIYNNNVNIKAHMRSGNLPGRFEISSTSKTGTILQPLQLPAVNISGLADTEYNGLYVEDGTEDGKPRYVKDSYEIRWNGSAWLLEDGGSNASSDSDVAYPWLAVNWYSEGIDPTGIVLTQAGSTTAVSKEDADFLPTRGQIVINNEYIKYTKGGELSNNTIQLILNERNVGGLTAGPKIHPANSTFVSYNQNCSPALSHWGVAALMDGFFNEDKSYLFTATNSTSMTATSADQALISFRLSPSVDYGINGRLGERNLINHSLLKPQQVGILTNNPLQVNVRVNCEPQTVFRNLSAWKFVANGSIAQYFDHTEDGSFEVQGTGGDLIASFLVTPEAEIGDGLFTSQSFDIGIVRELTNSILGGDFPFPDGPDVVTVSVKTLSHLDGNYNAICQGKISWTEDQG